MVMDKLPCCHSTPEIDILKYSVTDNTGELTIGLLQWPENRGGLYSTDRISLKQRKTPVGTEPNVFSILSYMLIR